MKNSKIVIVLTTLALIIIPVSIKAVSTIIEKVKVVPDVPEPILQNVPEEAYRRVSNDILEQEPASNTEFEEKLRKSFKSQLVNNDIKSKTGKAFSSKDGANTYSVFRLAFKGLKAIFAPKNKDEVGYERTHGTANTNQFAVSAG